MWVCLYVVCCIAYTFSFCPLYCQDVSSFGRGSECCASVCRCVLCAVNCIVVLFTVLSRCAIFQQCYCPDVSELTGAVWTVGRTQSLATLP